MKKIALYIVLFCYSLVIIKPVTPYLSNAVAHIFYYSQHMATVHYENGNLHVHKEVIEKSESSEKQQQAPDLKKSNKNPDHIVQSANELTSLSGADLCLPGFITAAHYDYYSGNSTPPPRI